MGTGGISGPELGASPRIGGISRSGIDEFSKRNELGVFYPAYKDTEKPYLKTDRWCQVSLRGAWLPEPRHVLQKIPPVSLRRRCAVVGDHVA